jgi:hypothetical protein
MQASSRSSEVQICVELKLYIRFMLNSYYSRKKLQRVWRTRLQQQTQDHHVYMMQADDCQP